jgi:hypothetical protein
MPPPDVDIPMELYSHVNWFYTSLVLTLILEKSQDTGLFPGNERFSGV